MTSFQMMRSVNLSDLERVFRDLISKGYIQFKTIRFSDCDVINPTTNTGYRITVKNSTSTEIQNIWDKAYNLPFYSTYSTPITPMVELPSTSFLNPTILIIGGALLWLVSKKKIRI